MLCWLRGQNMSESVDFDLFSSLVEWNKAPPGTTSFRALLLLGWGWIRRKGVRNQSMCSVTQWRSVLCSKCARVHIKLFWKGKVNESGSLDNWNAATWLYLIMGFPSFLGMVELNNSHGHESHWLVMNECQWKEIHETTAFLFIKLDIFRESWNRMTQKLYIQ